MAVLYIIILIGVLVFVHEFGHYIAARIFHVKVLSFSIGFGPRIGGFKRGETSWDIRLLPLGGYVQMYGTEFEEVVDTTDPDFPRAYNNKPIWQKAIINLAGPVFNLLLPIPILFAVYLATVTTDYPPTIGQVLDNTPATGVLEPGDLITHINGEEVKYWHTMSKAIRENPNEELRFTVLRDGKSLDIPITPAETTLRDSFDIMTETIGRLGITPDLAPPIIGITSLKSPAAAGGLQSFDEITSVNGTPIKSYVELEQVLRRNTADTLDLVVLRPQKLAIGYGTISVLNPVRIDIPAKVYSTAALGITSANMFLSEVDPGSPADKAGLSIGDRILKVDGNPVNLFRSFEDMLVQKWEDPHKLTVQRGDDVFDTTIQLEKLTITGEFQEDVPLIYAGFYHKTPMSMPEPVTKTMADRFTYAAQVSVSTTVKASTLLVVYVVRMFQGRVSTKSLGGPIMIGHMASKAGQDGLDAFLKMLAVISINLGILNLIPIPLFDGGKLAILFVEAVKRGPISMRTRQIIAYIGLAMVIMLLMLAFKNDLERMWNLFFS